MIAHHIADGTGTQHAEAQQPVFCRIDLPLHRIQVAKIAAGSLQRVAAFLIAGGMCAFACDVDVHFAGARHHLFAPVPITPAGSWGHRCMP